MKILTLPAVFALVALSACAAVGPNYHVPERAIVNAPAARGPFLSGAQVTTGDEMPDQWWKLFDDPVLTGLIERALASNTDLRIAEANLQRSSAMLAEAEATRQASPAVDLETSWAQPSAEAAMQHIQPPEHQIYNAGLSISYDLDLFGSIRRGIEAATADEEAAVAARDLVRVNVAAQTAQAYSDVCNAGHEIVELHRLIGLLGENLRLTRVMVAHGRAPTFERERQEGGLANVRSRLPQMEAAQRNAVFRITTLTGRPPAEFDQALLGCRTPLVLHQALPVGDGRALLKRRPDVRAAERRLAAATARIGVATAALYPDIKFGASLGSTGATADLLSPLTNRFGLGPMISWNLHRTAVRARISGAEAQTRASLAAFDGTVLSALREVETALNTYAADLGREADLRFARDDAARVAERTASLRRGGKLGGLAALDAQRSLIVAEQAVTAIQTDINRDQIALFLALGGGWHLSPARPE
ncbi:efflux transporter outer membrane subunit [Novosphingobium sp. KCTC 2891]|uniref:efflux transporter outer membrane subunit n=1 Tax=Novosphingobium sp. KCTC 2891 TaxID=2989730 RepID=UPI002223D53D|nr:efflux transporter outer membrane subunit [Novosphingobium sp. KCTC 2891]MCW1383784.1 efflux transporter outer membrane subunit [Novosphingobium sp. KCTC 2891]